jgi:hypothetical protein
VTLNDASWVVVGQMVYVDQAGGGVGQAGALQVTAKSGNQLTLLNPAPPPAIPLADNTQSGLLRQVSGNTTDFVDGTNNSQPLAAAVQPTIWSVRLKSFNSVQNCNFEVDQRNCGNALINPAAGVFIEDRWRVNRGSGTNVDCQQVMTATGAGGSVPVPGTSFAITRSLLRLTNRGVVSIAAGDYFAVSQTIEGPAFRELSGDVHSISILIRFSIANVKFGLSLGDPTGSRSLTKLCQSGAANTFVLVTLPNLPVFPPAGTFSTAAGAAGYQLTICLDCGTTFTAPANDTWQNGNFVGAVGQDHFCAQPVSTVCEIAFVQHEPGSQCTTLIDKPFSQNYDECLRYYAKSWNYETAVGTTTTTGMSSFTAANSHGSVWGSLAFAKRMAKTPSPAIYNPYITNGINGARDPLGANYTVSAPTAGQSGISGFNISPALGSTAAGMPIWFHYTADTGW